MPLTFTVTREDMLRSKIVDPAWYKAKIKDIIQETASDGESQNTVVDFVITEGPAKDTPLRRWFSEKAPGFIVPFLVAAGANVSEQGGTFDLEKAKGKEMYIYVKNRMYEGKPQNDVADFKSIESMTKAGA